MTHPKNEFLKAETTKRYGDRDSQYGGNRSRQLNIHRDDKNQNDEGGKSTAPQAGREGWPRPKGAKNPNVHMYVDLMSSYYDFINGPKTNNIAHGERCP